MRFKILRRADWILRSGNTKLYRLTDSQLDSKRICSEHFTDGDVQSIGELGMRKLKATAIPIDSIDSEILHELSDGEDSENEHDVTDEHVGDQTIDAWILILNCQNSLKMHNQWWSI